MRLTGTVLIHKPEFEFSTVLISNPSFPIAALLCVHPAFATANRRSKAASFPLVQSCHLIALKRMDGTYAVVNHARAIGLDRQPRWDAGDPERIHRYAAELVALTPDVILAVSSATTGAPVSMLVKSAFGLSLKKVLPFTM